MIVVSAQNRNHRLFTKHDALQHSKITTWHFAQRRKRKSIYIDFSRLTIIRNANRAWHSFWIILMRSSLYPNTSLTCSFAFILLSIGGGHNVTISRHSCVPSSSSIQLHSNRFIRLIFTLARIDPRNFAVSISFLQVDFPGENCCSLPITTRLSECHVAARP